MQVGAQIQWDGGVKIELVREFKGNIVRENESFQDQNHWEITYY